MKFKIKFCRHPKEKNLEDIFKEIEKKYPKRR